MVLSWNPFRTVQLNKKDVPAYFTCKQLLHFGFIKMLQKILGHGDGKENRDILKIHSVFYGH